MKEIGDCKNEVAKKYGYQSWSEIDWYAEDMHNVDDWPLGVQSLYEHEAIQIYADQFKPKWIPVSEYEVGIYSEVRIKLYEGSELNVLAQSDGDFWWDVKDLFINLESVEFFMPLPDKPV
jgi:hypothetical protein